MEVSYHEDVIGVKALVIQDLLQDKIILPNDVLLIFRVGSHLKYVSTPVETRFWTRAVQHQQSVSVKDDLKVKTFLKHGDLTVVDVLLLGGQMVREVPFCSWCFMVEITLVNY